MLTQDLVAEKLLWGLWRCITDDYKDRYKKDCWEHFENALKSASYTDSLKVFLTNFQKRIPVDLQAQYAKDMLLIIEMGEDDQVLNWLRTESTYLVMLVRIRNQDRKESLKSAYDSKLKQDDDFEEFDSVGNLTINENGEVVEK